MATGAESSSGCTLTVVHVTSQHLNVGGAQAPGCMEGVHRGVCISGSVCKQRERLRRSTCSPAHPCGQHTQRYSARSAAGSGGADGGGVA